MNGAVAVVEALTVEGVTQVFGLPGTTIMDVLDALAQQTAIRYISARHEQVAAFMADGYARVSGDVGVCIASRGPGAANLAAAIANSYEESIPVLAVIGQVADDIVERAAFEEMDVVGFFRPITKWAVEIHDPRRIPELLQRAIRLSMSGRRGPVVVSLPLDVLRAQVSVQMQPRFRAGTAAPAAADIFAAVDLLSHAKRPAIIVGGGVPAHHPAVEDLATRIGAPVVTTWGRKGLVRNSYPNYLGTLGYGVHPSTERAVKEADVILAAGCRFSEFTTARWTLLQSPSALIHVDVDPAEIGRIYVPKVGIPADAALTFDALCEALGGRPSAESNHLQRLREEYRADCMLPDLPSADSVTSGQLTSVLRELVAERSDVCIVMDAPSLGVWVQRYVEFERPGALRASAGGTMGWGFPAALGAALARPDLHVIAVSGDGSFWMVAQDLETAVRENIPVVNVVANNFAFGNTRDRQRTAYGGRYLGVFYGNADLAAYARLLGAHGERVERVDELLPAIVRALDSRKPAIVDVLQSEHEGLPPGLEPPAAR